MKEITTNRPNNSRPSSVTENKSRQFHAPSITSPKHMDAFYISLTNLSRCAYHSSSCTNLEWNHPRTGNDSSQNSVFVTKQKVT